MNDQHDHERRKQIQNQLIALIDNAADLAEVIDHDEVSPIDVLDWLASSGLTLRDAQLGNEQTFQRYAADVIDDVTLDDVYRWLDLAGLSLREERWEPQMAYSVVIGGDSIY